MKFWEALKILTEEGRPIQHPGWGDMRMVCEEGSLRLIAPHGKTGLLVEVGMRLHPAWMSDDGWRVYHETQAEGEEQATGVRPSGVAGRPAEVPPPTDDKADDQVDGPFNQKVDTIQCEGLDEEQAAEANNVFTMFLNGWMAAVDVIDLFRYRRGYDLKQKGNVLHVTKGVEP